MATNGWGVAEQALEPVPLVSGASVAAIALAVGFPLVVAPVAGLLTVGALAFGAARRKYGRPTSAATERARAVRDVKLNSRWKVWVAEADRDRVRFRDAVSKVADPAIRSSLEEISPRFDEVVDSVRVIAARGQQFEDALTHLPARSDLEQRLGRLDDRAAGPDDKRRASVTYQLDTRDRIERQIDDIVHRLEQIDADRDTAVVQAVEAGLQSDQRLVISEVTESIEHAVAELDALNTAMVEVDEIR